MSNTPRAAPVAWMYDQATYVEGDVRGRDWHPVVGKYEPTEHWMVRNVTPLYTSLPVEEGATCDCCARNVLHEKTCAIVRSCMKGEKP